MPDAADTFRDFVLDQLAALPDLRCSRMFGSYGLYDGGKFFGIISRSRLYFNTDETTREAYRERGSSPFRPKPKMELKRYYEVPLEILEDRDQLIHWARAAAGAGKPARERKNKSRKR